MMDTNKVKTVHCLICSKGPKTRKVKNGIRVLDRFFDLLSLNRSDYTDEFNMPSFPFCLICYKQLKRIDDAVEGLRSIYLQIEDYKFKLKEQIHSSHRGFKSLIKKTTKEQIRKKRKMIQTIRNKICNDLNSKSVVQNQAFFEKGFENLPEVEIDKFSEKKLPNDQCDNNDFGHVFKMNSLNSENVKISGRPNSITKEKATKRRSFSPVIEEDEIKPKHKKFRRNLSKTSIEFQTIENEEIGKKEEGDEQIETRCDYQTVFTEEDFNNLNKLGNHNFKKSNRNPLTSIKSCDSLNSEYDDQNENPERPKCPICGKSPKYLKSHMKTHEDLEKCFCDICKKEYKHKGSLKVHMLRYHSSLVTMKKFKCMEDGCGKEFDYPYLLEAHDKSHTQTKRFECNVCNIKFRLKHVMNAHMSVHAPNKMFSCHICDSAYSRKFNLDRHIKSHHQTNGNEIVPEWNDSDIDIKSEDEDYGNRESLKN